MREFPAFRTKFRPARRVADAWAQDDGSQKIEDTGPLTKERMKTIDEEILPEPLRFMSEAKSSNTLFFVWLNTTHMHFRTHIKDGSRGKAGRWQSEYHDTMVDHDDPVREFSYEGSAQTVAEVEPVTEIGHRSGWTVVSMARDFVTVFGSEPTQPRPGTAAAQTGQDSLTRAR
jgi:hypothetical protein